MLQTIDAEKFCSGHSEMANRKSIENHIDQMKKRIKKVKTLIKERKNLEEIKSEFKENEARLIESIYNDITK
jgi:hypothetical protein